MLFWTNLNPTVKLYPVKKLFYNKYFNKVKIYCPGTRVIESKNVEELTVRLNNRINITTGITYNYAGSWWNTYTIQELKSYSKQDQLIYYFNIKQNKTDVHFRLEEPYLTIYSNSDSELYNIVSQCYPERLLEVYQPKNDKEKEILAKGEIIASPKEQFNYKITLKPLRFLSLAQKHSLLDYIYNLNSEIKITKSLMNHLQSSSVWFPGGFLHSKDDKIILFINLICPSLIGTIFKLTKT